jgi:hypothetical protein
VAEQIARKSIEAASPPAHPDHRVNRDHVPGGSCTVKDHPWRRCGQQRLSAWQGLSAKEEEEEYKNLADTECILRQHCDDLP